MSMGDDENDTTCILPTLSMTTASSEERASQLLGHRLEGDKEDGTTGSGDTRVGFSFRGPEEITP
jgi:hypothetical protein